MVETAGPRREWDTTLIKGQVDKTQHELEYFLLANPTVDFDELSLQANGGGGPP